MTCSRFTYTKERRQVAHAHFLAVEGQENFQPARIGHGLEQITHWFELLVVVQIIASDLEPVFVDDSSFAEFLVHFLPLI